MTTTTTRRHRSAHAATTTQYSSLTGTATLLRFMLRRDRVRTILWVLGVGILAMYFAHAVQIIADDQTALNSLAGLYAEPGGRMMVGPGYGMDAPTHERFFASGYALYIYILMALFSIFTMVRHTRAEEQTGRAELVRANVVGRHTTLSAALLLTVLANLVMTLLIFGAAVSAGYAVHGSLLVATAGLGVGIFFTGVAACTAQLSQSSRGASALAGGLLAVAFFIRMLGDLGDIGGTALSWFSPLAWSQQTGPYVMDRWWPLLFLAAGAVVFTVLGYWLSTKRDLEASLIPARLGRREAKPLLGTPWGLATRTLGGGLRGWGIALVLVGLMFGAYAQTMLDAADTLPPELEQIFTGEDLMLGYLAYISLFMAVFIAAAGVSGVQQVRGEETAGRAEYTLSTPTGRSTWFLCHLGVILVGVLIILALVGAGMGLGAAVSLEEDGWQYFGDLLLASVLQAPAVVAVVGIVALLLGWLPRATSTVGWIVVGYGAVFTTFGDLLELPDFMAELNVFGHLAEYPVEDISWTPVIILTAIGVAGLVLGLLGFNRREINRI